MTDRPGPATGDASGDEDPEERRAFVTDLFDRIAPGYDRANFLVSLGQTSIWRLRAFLDVDLAPGDRVLDVGTGTGAVPRLLHLLHDGLLVEGLDPSEEMLRIARERDDGSIFLEGDVTSIPRPDGFYDLVTTVWTLRSFPDLEDSLREMVRVTAPDGRILCLDVFPPPPGLFRRLHRFWTHEVAPRLVAPLADPEAYRWLARSIEEHVDPEEVARLLEEAGCAGTEVRRYTLGAAARILARKADD